MTCKIWWEGEREREEKMNLQQVREIHVVETKWEILCLTETKQNKTKNRREERDRYSFLILCFFVIFVMWCWLVVKVNSDPHKEENGYCIAVSISSHSHLLPYLCVCCWMCFFMFVCLLFADKEEKVVELNELKQVYKRSTGHVFKSRRFFTFKAEPTQCWRAFRIPLPFDFKYFVYFYFMFIFHLIKNLYLLLIKKFLIPINIFSFIFNLYKEVLSKIRFWG